MNTQSYRTKRKGQPKQNSRVKGSKRHMTSTGKGLTTYDQSQIRAAYLAKAEWVHNVIPKLKE